MLLRALAAILKSRNYESAQVCSSANPLSHRSIYSSILLVFEAVTTAPIGGMRS
jgi:hypothetical protein